MLPHTKHRVSKPSLAVLSWTPRVQDHGSLLICNPDSATLHQGFPEGRAGGVSTSSPDTWLCYLDHFFSAFEFHVITVTWNHTGCWESLKRDRNHSKQDQVRGEMLGQGQHSPREAPLTVAQHRVTHAGEWLFFLLMLLFRAISQSYQECFNKRNSVSLHLFPQLCSDHTELISSRLWKSAQVLPRTSPFTHILFPLWHLMETVTSTSWWESRTEKFIWTQNKRQSIDLHGFFWRTASVCPRRGTAAGVPTARRIRTWVMSTTQVTMGPEQEHSQKSLTKCVSGKWKLPIKNVSSTCVFLSYTMSS